MSVTSDDPRLAEYREPDNVVRVDGAQKSLAQRMIDGEADFGIIGPEAPQHADARRLIPDHEEAAAAWFARHACAHINHVFVVRSELSESRPDVVDEIWRLLCETRSAAGPDDAKKDSLPFGVDAISSPLSLVNRYAHEPRIIPRPSASTNLFRGRLRTPNA